MLTSEAGFLYGASFCRIVVELSPNAVHTYRAPYTTRRSGGPPTLYLVTLRVHMFAGNAQIAAHFVNVNLIKYKAFCNFCLVSSPSYLKRNLFVYFVRDLNLNKYVLWGMKKLNQKLMCAVNVADSKHALI